MKIIRFLLLGFIVSIITPVVSQTLDSLYTKSDAFFKAHTKNGLVDYKSLHSNIVELESLYKTIGSTNLVDKTDDEKIAFYINAYNLIVIRQVAKYYPLKSVLNRSGFFNAEKHLVAGEKLTLDQIEKIKTIKVYKDPRVHFAFSCAALGCPQLASFAFKPSNLNSSLESRTKRAINDPTFTKIDSIKKRVQLSRIFEWYSKDFTTDGDIISYLNKYRTEKIPANYKVSYYEYDWALNEL